MLRARAVLSGLLRVAFWNTPHFRFIWKPCVTVVLDRPITKSSSASAWLGQPPSWLGQQSQLLLMCSCLLMSPSVSHQPTTISLLAVLVPRSKPHIHPSPLHVHRHDTSQLYLLHVHRLSLCSTPADNTRTHAMFAIVSIKMHFSTLNMWFPSHSNTMHLVLSVRKCVRFLTLKVRILPKVTTTLVKCFNWSIHL